MLWIVSSQSVSRSRPDVHDPPLVAGLGISGFWVQSAPRISAQVGRVLHCMGQVCTASTPELAVRHRVLIRCAVSMGRAAPPKRPVRRQQRRDDEMPVLFGRSVRAAREEAGMTQRDLADAADIPQPDIPAIERGERDVRLSTANRIARALNTMLRDLLPGR
jgi:DNA-binding XRE family transcriptional regulator